MYFVVFKLIAGFGIIVAMILANIIGTGPLYAFGAIFAASLVAACVFVLLCQLEEKESKWQP